MAAAARGLLELPGPVPELVVGFLNPAERKSLRLTCKGARSLIDRTVHSVTVDVSNVRVLCGPWRPLHAAFPHVRHLAVCLRSTGAVTWDPTAARASWLPLPRSAAASAAAADAGAANLAGNGAATTVRHPFGRRPASPIGGGPAAAAAGYSRRLLRDCVPQLEHLTSLDLTQCYLDPSVWRVFCAAAASALPPGVSLRLHPAAALLFPGRTWADRLGAMLRQLASTRPDVRVSVVACGAGEGGGSVSTGGAACWCDVDGEAGLQQVAQMPYIMELAICVWSRSPCQPAWLEHLAGLIRLRRLHISCCNASYPWRNVALGSLSVLSALRELSIGLTDSPLRMSDLAPLSACSALTALSVGWLAALPAAAAAGGEGAGAAGVGVDGGGGGADGDGSLRDGGGGGGGVIPLLSVRRLEVRCCLSAGLLPLYDLAPAAIHVSMCALTMGGGGRVLLGHALTSILPATATAPPTAPLLLPRLPLHRRTPGTVTLRPPPPTISTGPQQQQLLHRTLRSLELVQRDTAAMMLGFGGEGTGRAPLPGVEALGELMALEALQLTGWRLRGTQLPALLAAAQRLPRLRLLTLRDCGPQSFGWRASQAAQLGRGLGLGPLDRLVGLQLRSLEHIQVLGAPNLQLMEQVALACRAPSLQRLELHGVSCWDPKAFQRILGASHRQPSTAAVATAKTNTNAAFDDASSGKAAAAGGGVRAGTAATQGSRDKGGGGGGGRSCTSRSWAALTAASGNTAAAVGGVASGCWLYNRRSMLGQVVEPKAAPQPAELAAHPSPSLGASAGSVPLPPAAGGAEAGGTDSDRDSGPSGRAAAFPTATVLPRVAVQLGPAGGSGGSQRLDAARRCLPSLPQLGWPAASGAQVGGLRDGYNINIRGDGGGDADDGDDSIEANGGGPPQCGCWAAKFGGIVSSGGGVYAGRKSRDHSGAGAAGGGPIAAACAGIGNGGGDGSGSGSRGGERGSPLVAAATAKATGGPRGGGGGGPGAAGGGGRWPRLRDIVVHGCPGTSFEAVRRHAEAAGLGPWVQVEWMGNTQSLGRDPWVGGCEARPERWPGPWP